MSPTPTPNGGGLGAITPELIARYAGAVPRYTSYPTANHFSAGVGAADYRAWLAALDVNEPLSLYVHIPYCHELCWYCGCTTKATQRYQPVVDYLGALEREIAAVSAIIRGRAKVGHIHWGGGSPSILIPEDIRWLNGALRSAFDFAKDADYAVEVDPRHMDAGKIEAFASSGVTRVSLGVQDFEPAVQKAINRYQSFMLTRSVLEALRDAGVGSLNIDLVYGLPHQTEASVQRTVEQVLELRPDRVAIFGYAHIPSRMVHQRLIDATVLPGPAERYAQARRVAGVLARAGYIEVGLDHFALPTDAMGKAKIRRNFQGYTTDKAETLIGLGASSIGRLPQGYVQNAPAFATYAELVEKGGIATVRGARLSEDDRLRAAVIEGLMCDFKVSADELRAAYGPAAGPILKEAHEIAAHDPDGLVRETSEGLSITDRGRPFVRAICARFDAYHGQGGAKHASGV